MAKKTKKKDLSPKAEAGYQMFVRGVPPKRAPKKSMRPRLRPVVKPSRGQKFSGTY